MNCGITQRQHDLLQFIKAFHATNGFSPSFDEMRTGLGLKSRASVHRLLTALEKRRFIHRVPGLARAIEIDDNPHFEIDLTSVPFADLYAELNRRLEA